MAGELLTHCCCGAALPCAICNAVSAHVHLTCTTPFVVIGDTEWEGDLLPIDLATQPPIEPFGYESPETFCLFDNRHEIPGAIDICDFYYWITDAQIPPTYQFGTPYVYMTISTSTGDPNWSISYSGKPTQLHTLWHEHISALGGPGCPEGFYSNVSSGNQFVDRRSCDPPVYPLVFVDYFAPHYSIQATIFTA